MDILVGYAFGYKNKAVTDIPVFVFVSSRALISLG
jgi:hypothetical protein